MKFESVAEITQEILTLEQQHSLFEWEVDGVYVWEILRAKVYSEALTVNFDAVPVSGSSLTKRLKILASKLIYKVRKLWHGIVYHPFSDRRTCDVLVLESSRKFPFNGGWIDPYTHFTTQELKAQGKKVDIYQSSFAFDRFAKRTFTTKHLELLYILSDRASKKEPVSFTSKDLEVMGTLQSALQTRLNVWLDVPAVVRKEAALFKQISRRFSKILQRKRPEVIYMVNFCDKAGLIHAAKKQGIQVIDIQHGVISSDDAIYHYPDIQPGSLRYFPDYFYTWSNYWKECCIIPLEESKIIAYGNRYLERCSANYGHVTRSEQQIVVISQPGLTRMIAAEIIGRMDSFRGHTIIYKLHPGEVAHAFQLEEIRRLNAMDNVRIEAEKIDLYALFAASRQVIGVYSTALVEALEFGCATHILKLPGCEMMEYFIETGQMDYLHTVPGREHAGETALKTDHPL